MIAKYGLGDDSTNIDTSNTFLNWIYTWDWHEYVLAGIAGYLIFNKLTAPIKQNYKRRKAKSKRREQLKKELAEL